MESEKLPIDQSIDGVSNVLLATEKNGPLILLEWPEPRIGPWRKLHLKDVASQWRGESVIGQRRLAIFEPEESTGTRMHRSNRPVY